MQPHDNVQITFDSRQHRTYNVRWLFFAQLFLGCLWDCLEWGGPNNQQYMFFWQQTAIRVNWLHIQRQMSFSLDIQLTYLSINCFSMLINWIVRRRVINCWLWLSSNDICGSHKICRLTSQKTHPFVDIVVLKVAKRTAKHQGSTAQLMKMIAAIGFAFLSERSWKLAKAQKFPLTNIPCSSFKFFSLCFPLQQTEGTNRLTPKYLAIIYLMLIAAPVTKLSAAWWIIPKNAPPLTLHRHNIWTGAQLWRCPRQMHTHGTPALV